MLMIQIKAGPVAFTDHANMWKPILSAPFGRHLELAVLDEDGEHALVFPCTKGRDGWMNAVTGVRIDVHPTHWRDWESMRVLANTSKPIPDLP
jgi:hypothetical protein